MSGLRLRLALGLAALAAVAVALPGVVWIGQAGAAERADAERLAAALEADVEGALAEWRRRLALCAAGGGEPCAAMLAWTLAPDGSILECRHWPAREGGRAPALLERLAGAGPAGEPMVGSVVVRDRDVAAWLQAGAVASGDGAHRVAGLDLEREVARLPELADTRWRLLAPGEAAAPVTPAGVVAGLPLDRDGGWRLTASRPGTARPGAARHLLASVGLAALAAALLAGMAGAWWAGRLLRPLADLDELAGALAGGRLDFELDSDRTDEIGRLAASFNRMTAALRRQRQELAVSARLAAWRDAARRMAHEVKNPLAPIRMSVENLARARTRAPERFDDLLAEESRTIIEEVDALARLVDSFSRFARLPEPRPQTVDPGEPVRRVARLHRDAAPGVDLDVDVPDGLPAAELDPDLIAQVLTNLLANALAVVARPGGRVAMACRVEGETVVYRVRDNGPGIPAEIRERLFEPRVGVRPGGSGLGLAVARQIVTAHGGHIGFESVPGDTSFTVRLPRTAAGKAP